MANGITEYTSPVNDKGTPHMTKANNNSPKRLSPVAKAKAAEARARRAEARKAGITVSEYDKVKKNVKQKESLADMIANAKPIEPEYTAPVKVLPRDNYYIAGTNPEDLSRNYRLPNRTI